MNIKRKRRIYFIVFLLAGLGVIVSLALFALRQNIDLYYTPQQIQKQHVSMGREFRLGGMVVKGSVQHVPNSLQVSFILSDYHAEQKVNYDGILPSLFREGQGIVAQGRLDQQGVFVADQVLAKHDNQYKPPTK